MGLLVLILLEKDRKRHQQSLNKYEHVSRLTLHTSSIINHIYCLIGAGKTSLLNILAGRTRSKGNLAVTADVRLNNYSVDPTSLEVRKQIAFVAQDDSLQITATPREAIRFSAKLRLPKKTTEREIETLTTKMLESLGLTHCADTYIGGALLKGISGGERKRTSVGVELVTKPAIVFLDEPTR